MGIIEIEWDFGKSYADKLIIWVFRSILYYAYQFIRKFISNYSKYRSKSKIQSFTKIDFKKTVYPFAFYGILLPTTLGYIVKIYTPDNIFSILVGIYVGILVLVFVYGFFYFFYRVFIDFGISVYCFVKSLITTTVCSIRYLSRKKL
jgi:hypothetical protein